MQQEQVSFVSSVSEYQWLENIGMEANRTVCEEAVQAFARQMGITVESVAWLSSDEFAQSYGGPIERTGLYAQLVNRLQSIKESVKGSDQEIPVAKAVDQVTDAVFHPVFDKAYERLGGYSEEAAKNAVKLAVVIAAAAFAHEAAGMGEENSFAKLSEVLAYGHLPVNWENGRFAIL